MVDEQYVRGTGKGFSLKHELDAESLPSVIPSPLDAVNWPPGQKTPSAGGLPAYDLTKAPMPSDDDEEKPLESHPSIVTDLGTLVKGINPGRKSKDSIEPVLYGSEHTLPEERDYDSLPTDDQIPSVKPDLDDD